MRQRVPRWLVPLTCLLLAGCQTALLRSPDFKRPPGPVRVLLMPPDVELSELTAGGLLEPKAEWTERAKRHVTAGLRRALESRQATVVAYQEPPDDPEQTATEAQLVKLHDVVGATIIAHAFVPELRLPTKEGKFDWSLGPGVAGLRARPVPTTRCSSSSGTAMRVPGAWR